MSSENKNFKTFQLKIPSSDSKYVQNFGFQQIEVMAGAPIVIKQRHIIHEWQYSDIKLSLYSIDFTI